jgi:hypothetical protein
MHVRKALLPFVLAGTLFAAQPAYALGANSDNNLKEVTAVIVTQDTGALTEPDAITLQNVRRGMFRVSWQAMTPNGLYACTSDDMVRNPQCSRVNEPAQTASTAPTAAVASE